ncbi:hypothetical protein CVIRNUC_005989 [Coccomyxa viridis]|uniref:Bacterial Ig-like domain-containing protein n=1 Tax=Coccomyxa viridis TaxID=1274662 RepID=A0AAV1IA29_9CHLO|nr:hypothetical protein CVIRNUC_005989 [Coccomyxa viridis]
MAELSGLLLFAAALLFMALASQAQYVPSIGLYGEVLNYQVTPVGTTAYGTPRTFSATVVNLGTGNKTFGGSISFVDTNGDKLCNTTVQPTALIGTTVSANSTGNITLYLEALNYNIAQFPNGTIKTTLGLALNAAALFANVTTLGANTPIIADTLDLATGALLAAGILPLKVTAAAVAVCQTDSIPAGTYTGVGVALAALTFDGSPAGPSILNPSVGLGLFSFTVRKAITLIYSNDSPAAKAGASTTLTVLVNNTDAPPSDLPLEGGTVTVLLGSASIGTAALSGAGRRRLLALTSTFSVTITVPAGTAAGSQVLTLQYSGDSNFNPSTSGQNGSPGGPTLLVIAGTGTTVTETVVPTNPAANAPMNVSGKIYPSDGSNPVGTITIAVTPTGGGSPVSYTFPVNGPSYTEVIPAPGTPGPYTVVTTFTPAAGSSASPGTSSPTTITVGPPAATITETLAPNPADPGATVTVTGTVTNANGSPGAGTVQLYLAGVPVGAPIPLGAGGTFTGTFPAPQNGGTYVVRTDYTPTGAPAPVASYATNLVVNGGSGGTAPLNLTAAFGGGANGFRFPNCLGNLTLTVSGAGAPPPTGNLTLIASGGGKNSTLGSVPFSNGNATIVLQSVKVDDAVKMKLQMTSLDSSTDWLSLLPRGETPLLPGSYSLIAVYSGDSVYAAASVSTPYAVDTLCLLQVLHLAV